MGTSRKAAHPYPDHLPAVAKEPRRFVGIREDGKAYITSNVLRDERGFLFGFECDSEFEAVTWAREWNAR